jgi:hypothetical protein
MRKNEENEQPDIESKARDINMQSPLVDGRVQSHSLREHAAS